MRPCWPTGDARLLTLASNWRASICVAAVGKAEGTGFAVGRNAGLGGANQLAILLVGLIYLVIIHDGDGDRVNIRISGSRLVGTVRLDLVWWAACLAFLH